MAEEGQLRNFLEYVVGTLVTRPEAVVIDYEPGEGRHVFRLTVDEEDVGRVIGKEGHTIKAIRNLMSASVEREGAVVIVKVENENPGGGAGGGVGGGGRRNERRNRY